MIENRSLLSYPEGPTAAIPQQRRAQRQNCGLTGLTALSAMSIDPAATEATAPQQALSTVWTGAQKLVRRADCPVRPAATECDMEELWTPLPKSLAKRIEQMAARPEGDTEARLPSQRELALLLGASRTSVREAMSSLEASGKVRTEPGRGCYWVSTEQSESGAQPATDTAGQLQQRTYPKSEISRLRYLVEGQSARLAAMRITNKEVEQLEKTLTTFKAQTRAMDLEASAKTDFQFHHLIITFSGVSLFRDLHIAFRDVIMSAVRMYRSQYSRAWEPVSEHEKILEALRRRDPDEAVYYSQSHIVRSADRLGIIDSSEIL